MGQYFQKRAYNKGRLTLEFSEGNYVLLNLHSLFLLRSEKGRGKKLLMKYDRPFEVIQKHSTVSYQLWMLASYGIYPIIHIAHLKNANLHLPNLVVNLPKVLIVKISKHCQSTKLIKLSLNKEGVRMVGGLFNI